MKGGWHGMACAGLLGSVVGCIHIIIFVHRHESMGGNSVTLSKIDQKYPVRF